MRSLQRLLSIYLVAVVLFSGLLLDVSAVAATKDVQGSKDHPLVTRMPGFVIGNYNVEEFAAFEPSVIGGESVRWEGKKFSLSYDLKEGATQVSMLQIVRNYEAALKTIGAKILGGDERRVAADLRKDDQIIGVYVEAFNEGSSYEVTIVESKPMRQDVTADAAAMSKDLGAAGKTVIYGIHFDTGLAIIKPDSEPALSEMVKLMKNTPDLKVFIVGHTDNAGELDMNQRLSEARAAALVKALVARGIDAGRMKAFGAGPCCPVASNRNDQGRTQNRRVELVEQ